MKKFFQYSGVIALALGLVAIILIMATPVMVTTTNGLKNVDGIQAIFGGDFKLSWAALLAWIFILIAVLILLAGIILPLLKVKALEKFAGILNLVTVGLLVVAGIFLFMAKGTFVSAQDSITKAILENGYAAGAGFIIAGILAIAGGVIAILPAAIDLSKKK